MDITHCDAIVDAILGTGLEREVKGFTVISFTALTRVEEPCSARISLPVLPGIRVK
jgi:NAD(P)H-hydrate repair Nnr-like enzyme with NAD(P)H-hydrate epimerase domain